MKVRVQQLVNVANLISGLALNKLNNKELEEKVLNLYLSLTPYIREHTEALVRLQQDAKGKSVEEVETLVSGKAFLEIANREVEVEEGFTLAEIKQIGSQIEGCKLSDYQVLTAVQKD